ncbi:MAG: hypothetical protein ACJ8R9_17945 [Steroidobacteraceae bacterium]
MSVDVRRAVVVAFDVHITVRMKGGVLPVRVLEVADRKRLEGGFLERLEALAARDTEAGMAPRVDPLDTLTEGLVDLGERGEPRASIAEARIAHQYFHQPLDDRLVLGMIWARRDHRC